MEKKFMLKIKQKIGDEYDYVLRHRNKIEILAWVIPRAATKFSKNEAEYFCQLNPDYKLEMEEFHYSDEEMKRNKLFLLLNSFFIKTGIHVITNEQTIDSHEPIIGFYYDENNRMKSIERESSHGKEIVSNFFE